jgi:hypothetical protein
MAGFIFCPMLSGRWLVVGIVLGMIIALLGLNLLTNTCYSLFLWTASGNDLPEKDDWQEYQFFISDLFTMWLFFLTMIAATPGYLLVLFFSAPTDILQQDIIQQQITDNIPLYYILLTLISVILFFPVLFLSCMESDSYFAILAEGTCRSLLRSTKIWLRFYGISLLLAILFCVIIGAISAMVRDRIFAGFAAAVPAAAIFLLLYARLLGRLGWALEEQGRLDDSDY